MTTMQRISATSEVRAVNADSLTIDIIASTSALDSYNTKIEQSGWVLDQFRKNPVICFQHDSGGGFFGAGANKGLPVAKALPETVRIEGDKLLMRIQFMAQDVDAFSYKIFRMIQAGFLSGISVGFDPLEWKDEESEPHGRVRIFTKCRLMEVSVVTIPANDEAMVVRSRERNREDEVEQWRTLATEIESEAEVRAKRQPQTVDDVLLLLDDCPAKELIVKHRNYFDDKQKVNKASSRFLKKFYKSRSEEIPEDEKQAWEKAEGLIEAPAETKPEERPEEVKPVPVEAPAETVEAPAEVQAEETPAEQAPEEPSTPTPEEAPRDAQEAPEPGRKATVLIPLSALSSLRRSIKDTCVQAAVEASRQGMPVKELSGVIDAVGQQFQGALSTHP